jgi:hypothetical protein
MAQCEHLYTHIIQLFISPRGKVVPPLYGRLNKEGVIKLPATSLSRPLHIQILAQKLSDILELLMSLKWIECQCCGFFNIYLQVVNIAPEVIIYFLLTSLLLFKFFFFTSQFRFYSLSFSVSLSPFILHSVQNLLSSSFLSKHLKIKIYRTIILPVVLYGCETWSLILRGELRLRVFENGG